MQDETVKTITSMAGLVLMGIVVSLSPQCDPTLMWGAMVGVSGMGGFMVGSNRPAVAK